MDKKNLQIGARVPLSGTNGRNGTLNGEREGDTVEVQENTFHRNGVNSKHQ